LRICRESLLYFHSGFLRNVFIFTQFSAINDLQFVKLDKTVNCWPGTVSLWFTAELEFGKSPKSFHNLSESYLAMSVNGSTGYKIGKTTNSSVD